MAQACIVMPIVLMLRSFLWSRSEDMMGNGFEQTLAFGACAICFRSSERRAPLGPEARIHSVVAHELSFFANLNVTSRGDFRDIFIDLFL